MSIRLCVGEYAKKGYEPEGMGIKLYSLEELCFFIKENAYLLDDGFRDQELGTWLVQECKLEELGEEIKKAVYKKVPLKLFAEILLEYTCLFAKEVNDEILNIIEQNSSRSVYEKRKSKADALVARGCYGMAGREYGRLLKILPDEQTVLRGEIYHGCGVCLARMFYFSKAGDYFLKAYDLTGKTVCYQQYLWTKKFSMTEKEYKEFLREHKEACEDSIDMEEKLELFLEQWKRSKAAMILHNIREEKEMYHVSKYQEKLEQRVEYMKDAYREMLQ